MKVEYGLYSNVNESPIYIPNVLTPKDIEGERKIVSGCKLFDKYKKSNNKCI